MANLHIESTAEIGNTGKSLNDLIYPKIACFGYSGDQSAHSNGDRIIFNNTIFNNAPNNIVPYSNGIIDIKNLTKGKHYIKLSLQCWVEKPLDTGVRPWLKIVRYEDNKPLAEYISHNSTPYHSIVISNVIVPFDPGSTDGIMRLVVMLWCETEWYVNVGSGWVEYMKDRNVITIEILELDN